MLTFQPKFHYVQYQRLNQQKWRQGDYLEPKQRNGTNKQKRCDGGFKTELRKFTGSNKIYYFFFLTSVCSGSWIGLSIPGVELMPRMRTPCI